MELLLGRGLGSMDHSNRMLLRLLMHVNRNLWGSACSLSSLFACVGQANGLQRPGMFASGIPASIDRGHGSYCCFTRLSGVLSVKFVSVPVPSVCCLQGHLLQIFGCKESFLYRAVQPHARAVLRPSTSACPAQSHHAPAASCANLSTHKESIRP